MEPMKPMAPMKPMEPMKPMDFGEPWWPKALGEPSSSGSQDGMRYAFFPESRRLLVDRGGTVTTYDAADHLISGVSQQDSGAQTVTFTSQDGPVKLDELKTL